MRQHHPCAAGDSPHNSTVRWETTANRAVCRRPPGKVRSPSCQRCPQSPTALTRMLRDCSRSTGAVRGNPLVTTRVAQLAEAGYRSTIRCASARATTKAWCRAYIGSWVGWLSSAQQPKLAQAKQLIQPARNGALCSAALVDRLQDVTRIQRIHLVNLTTATRCITGFWFHEQNNSFRVWLNTRRRFVSVLLACMYRSQRKSDTRLPATSVPIDVVAR